MESYFEVDPLLSQHLESATVFKETSKAIQNDILHSIAMVIKADIDREMNAAPFIAVQADDTTDVSCQCQLSVILRYVNEKGNVRERFLGFEDVSAERDAVALTEVVTLRSHQKMQKAAQHDPIQSECRDALLPQHLLPRKPAAKFDLRHGKI